MAQAWEAAAVAAIKRHGALAALTQAALALPGFAAAAETQTEYLYSHYAEADVPAANMASGRDAERYTIDSHRFRLVKPLSEDEALGLNLSYETLSGASPWYVTPGADGRPLQVMSGASIREERYVARGTWSRPLLGTQAAYSAGYSKEDDYESLNGGVELALDSEDRRLTWTGGLGYSSDRLEPVRGRSSPNVIDQADKRSLTAYGGVAVVVDRRTVAQASISYQHSEGFLSDPYKLAWVQEASNALPDHRPANRDALVLAARLRRHFDGPQGALALDYRYYSDDWHVEAHTAEISWHQLLPQQWRLSPALRWYSQSQAYFYAPYYESAEAGAYLSSDYRLSPFGALAWRLDLSKTLGDHLDLGLGYEHYEADARYALKHVVMENPALVEYRSVHLRLSYRF